MGKLIPMADHIEEPKRISKEKKIQESSYLQWDEVLYGEKKKDLLPDEYDPCWEIPNKPKRIVKKSPTSISIQYKNQFVCWLKGLDPSKASNNEVKRFKQKDGSFRESHVRGFFDLWEEFVANYDRIVKEQEKEQ